MRLEVDFYFESEIVHGTSRDISLDGIRVLLNGSAVVGSQGRISIHNGTMCLELHAKVTYIHRNETALAFCFKSPWERERLAALVYSFQKVSRFQKSRS